MSTKDIYEKYHYDISDIKRSKSWFEQQVLLLAKERINRATFHRTHGTRVTSVMPGNMYMFFYDPKTKDKLPHYDTFPLVFPFEKTADGFMGLNMHYLPYKLRFMLFETLLKFKNTKSLDDKTKLRYSWSTLKGLSRHQLAEQCIKRYLFDHVQSQFKLVHPTDWTTTLMLPVESFVKAKKTQVWGQ